MDNQVYENHDIVEKNTAWTSQVLAIGGVLGALTGLGAAYVFIQRAKKVGQPPDLNAMDGIKLALLVFGLLRSVAMLGGGDDK